MGVGHVGVYLRCRDVGVTQHLLHRTNIRAILHKVRSERMPQRVRRNVLKTYFLAVIFDELVKDLSVQRLSDRRHEQVLYLDILLFSSQREIAIQPFDSA